MNDLMDEVAQRVGRMLKDGRSASETVEYAMSLLDREDLRFSERLTYKSLVTWWVMSQRGMDERAGGRQRTRRRWHTRAYRR